MRQEANAMTAVQARELTKRYKGKSAVNSLDITVEKGELFALLGVNGAGKTTTIRMLTCLSKPTGGEAFVCGHNVSTESALVKKAVGVSPQDTAVAENLTVRENLELMAKIYGFTQEKRNERVAEMQRMFKLDEVMEQRTKTLSGGWKRRVSIAMALISEPEVLFLDEPTLGLDVLAPRTLERYTVTQGKHDRDTDHPLHGGSRTAFRPYCNYGQRETTRGRNPLRT